MRVEITSGPAEHDEVLAETGARYFSIPTPRPISNDKVLDAKVDDQGGAHFMLVTRGYNGHGPQT